MKYATLRDALLAMLAGAAAPWLLIAALGLLHALIRGPRERISAFLNPFLNPGSSRVPRTQFATLAADLALGTILGLALGLLVAWLTRTRYWQLWLAFTAAFLASLVVYAGLDGHVLRLLLSFRQPASVGVLVGASAGLWLGTRSASARGTN
jgi:hypothetical protein